MTFFVVVVGGTPRSVSKTMAPYGQVWPKIEIEMLVFSKSAIKCSHMTADAANRHKCRQVAECLICSHVTRGVQSFKN